MTMQYILDGHKPVVCEDPETWAEWFVGNADARKVNRTEIGPYLVSTVFLGLDHGVCGGNPILFETMVFRNGETSDTSESYMERCSTWEQAEEQHQRAISIYSRKLIGAAFGVS